MTKSQDFCVSTFWGPRKEGFESAFGRYLAVMARLPSIDPIFEVWFCKQGDEIMQVDYSNINSFESCVRQSKGDHENLGYHSYFRTAAGKVGPRTFALSITVGCMDFNAATLATEGFEHVDPSLVEFRIFRAALLTLAESFGAERGYAFPAALADHWKPKPYGEPGFPMAWISYVAPRATHLITPPSNGLVERRPDGGLLMAATDETFDVGNPAHIAVAHDIEAAVAPLHGHPWLPEDTA